MEREVFANCLCFWHNIRPGLFPAETDGSASGKNVQKVNKIRKNKKDQKHLILSLHKR